MVGCFIYYILLLPPAQGCCEAVSGIRFTKYGRREETRLDFESGKEEKAEKEMMIQGHGWRIANSGYLLHSLTLGL